MYKRWRAKGYFTREAADKTITLHMRVNVSLKAKKRGPQANAVRESQSQSSGANALESISVHSHSSSSSESAVVNDENGSKSTQHPLVAAAVLPDPEYRNRLVPKVSDVLQHLEAAHTETLHGGSKRTWERLDEEFVGVPRVLVEAYCRRCVTCAEKMQKKANRKPVIISIVSGYFNERWQWDLMDMQKTPGGPRKDYRYILHGIDHFTRFSILIPIKHKSKECVASAIGRTWSLFGAPDIIHCDNGKEFKNELMDQLCNTYSVQRIYGRAYHPQSQGSVERANSFAKSKLQAWAANSAHLFQLSIDWVPGLYLVQQELNRTKRKGTKRTPYELVFNRLHTTRGDRERLADVEDSTEALQLFADAVEEDIDVSSDVEMVDAPQAAAAAAATAESDAAGDAMRRRHLQMTNEARASNDEYKQRETDYHNRNVSQYVPLEGDLVSVKLRKRALSALHLPRG
jgi:transposase InsO family protein